MFSQQLYNVTLLKKILSKYHCIIIHVKSLISFFTVDGPDTLKISPSVNKNTKLSIKEGEALGPYDCSTDCNPPCDVTWQYADTGGHVHKVNSSKNTARLNLIVNRTIILFSCVGIYNHSLTLKQNMSLIVQCKSLSLSLTLSLPLSLSLMYL